MWKHLGSLGVGAALVATVMTAPNEAIAADPLLPTGAGWVAISDGTKWVTTGDAVPARQPYGQWASFDDVHFKMVPIGNGLSSVTSLTIERPRGQFDHPLGLPMGKSLGAVDVLVRKPAVNGQADWYYGYLLNAKVVADEVRTHEGSTTGTEILILSFSSFQPSHRTQNAQGYGPWAQTPSQFDIVGNVVLPAPPPAPPGPARPTPPSGMRQ